MARVYETNDRVIMVEDGEIRHGVIAQVFEHVPVVIVKFDDGEVEKVNPQRLANEPIEKKEEPKVKEKVEEAITLTKSEFIRKMAEMTVKEFVQKEDTPIEVTLLFGLFTSKATTKLFDESEANA